MWQRPVKAIISHSVMAGASCRHSCFTFPAPIERRSRYISGPSVSYSFSPFTCSIYFLITGYYISKLSVHFFLKCLCSVFVPLRWTGWIIHLQADEKRAGKVWSAEVEWPWFPLAAGRPAVAVVIIHTSQMAFLWASVKRTGQGLCCQVVPGPETTHGPVMYLERG